MKQKGFGAVEIILLVAVVAAVGVGGWYVWQANNKKPTVQSDSQTTQQTEATPESEPEQYTFTEMGGITMNVVDGWQVKAETIEESGSTFYSWTVEKPGADGKISFKSEGFMGGFSNCDEPNSLTAATVKDVAPTQNSNLMFIDWEYEYNGQVNNRTSIVRTDENVFRTANNTAITAIPNKDVKAGTYFFCISEPQTGWSLDLSQTTPGFDRHDHITALSSDSSTNDYVTLPDNAQSYADIKSMLTSIK